MSVKEINRELNVMAVARPITGMSQKDYENIVDAKLQRRRGIYYTPSLAAEAMAKWSIRLDTDRVLEPCFGSGVFLEAFKKLLPDHRAQVFGVELMHQSYDAAIRAGSVDANHATLGDFLSVKPFGVNAVVGNPPYVRLRSLTAEQEERARRATEEALGCPMDSAGSVWMAFVLHAVRFLVRGGRIAFVLPFELTHVRYAKPLWRYLGSNFGDIRVARVKERLFPELMQEAIVLFADNWGGSTTIVRYEAYEKAREFLCAEPSVSKELSIKSIIEERPFVRALLPDELEKLLQERLFDLTSPVPEFCTFNIGYVSGNRTFFQPDEQTIERFQLPQTSLRSTVTASRELSGLGLRTSAIHSSGSRKLFSPNGKLTVEEHRYIRQGESDNVDAGYKCRNRSPWYKVPDVRVPDLLLSVFKEIPSLVLNDGGLVASNSILCGFARRPFAAEQFISAWYTSLTLLSCELQVHSLGGGVLVLIPGEVARVRIPWRGLLPTTHMNELDRVLRMNGNAYQVGDDPILVKSLGLTSRETMLVQEGVRTLAKWRKAYGKQKSVKKLASR